MSLCFCFTSGVIAVLRVCHLAFIAAVYELSPPAPPPLSLITKLPNATRGCGEQMNTEVGHVHAPHCGCGSEQAQTLKQQVSIDQMSTTSIKELRLIVGVVALCLNASATGYSTVSACTSRQRAKFLPMSGASPLFSLLLRHSTFILFPCPFLLSEFHSVY